MNRILLSLSLFLTVAVPAYAQQNGASATPRVVITPFVGGRIPFGTQQTYFSPDSSQAVFFDEERGGGALVGLNTEVRVREPFSAVAGVAYSTAGDIVFTAVELGADELGEDETDAVRLSRQGSTFLVAKAGVAYSLSLPDPDTRRFRSLGALVLAPALVRETPADQSAINHFAINLGYRALLPLRDPRFAFQLVFEDYITFWNTGEYERADRAVINEPGLIVDFDSPRGNLFMLHAGLAFTFGGRAPAPARIYVPPAPAPAAMQPAANTVRVCIVDGRELREVDATVSPTTGDTLVNGRRFSEVYPGTTAYAAGRDFYTRGEIITVNRSPYVGFGLTRIIPADALTRAGEYQGVPLFRERGGTGIPEVLYLPVRPGCEFQPYQREQAIRGVRG